MVCESYTLELCVCLKVKRGISVIFMRWKAFHPVLKPLNSAVLGTFLASAAPRKNQLGISTCTLENFLQNIIGITRYLKTKFVVNTNQCGEIFSVRRNQKLAGIMAIIVTGIVPLDGNLKTINNENMKTTACGTVNCQSILKLVHKSVLRTREN